MAIENGKRCAAAESSGTTWADKGGAKWASTGAVTDRGGTRWADEGGTTLADEGGTKCALKAQHTPSVRKPQAVPLGFWPLTRRCRAVWRLQSRSDRPVRASRRRPWSMPITA